MNIVGLKDAANIGLVRCAAAQPLDGGGLVAEGFEELIRKFLRVERAFCERATVEGVNFGPQRASA